MLHDAADYADRSLRRLAEQERDYTLQDSPFAKWMRRYGVSFDQDRDCDRIELDFRIGRYSKAEIRRILRSGLESAMATSSHLAYDMIQSGVATYTTDGGDRRQINPFQSYGGVTKVLGRFEIPVKV